MDIEEQNKTDGVPNLFEDIGVENETNEPTPEQMDEIRDQLATGQLKPESEDTTESITEQAISSDPALEKLVPFDWRQKSILKRYFVLQKVGTVALIRTNLSQQLQAKPYEKGTDYSYYCMPESELHVFVDSDGDERVSAELHLIWQFCKTAMRQLIPILEKYEGWKYILVYRRSERQSIYKVLADDEAESAKLLDQEGLVSEYFPRLLAEFQKRARESEEESGA